MLLDSIQQTLQSKDSAHEEALAKERQQSFDMKQAHQRELERTRSETEKRLKQIHRKQLAEKEEEVRPPSAHARSLRGRAHALARGDDAASIDTIPRGIDTVHGGLRPKIGRLENWICNVVCSKGPWFFFEPFDFFLFNKP